MPCGLLSNIGIYIFQNMMYNNKANVPADFPCLRIYTSKTIVPADL